MTKGNLEKQSDRNNEAKHSHLNNYLSTFYYKTSDTTKNIS